VTLWPITEKLDSLDGLRFYREYNQARLDQYRDGIHVLPSEEQLLRGVGSQDQQRIQIYHQRNRSRHGALAPSGS
jgi:hypothetical protein